MSDAAFQKAFLESMIGKVDRITTNGEKVIKGLRQNQLAQQKEKYNLTDEDIQAHNARVQKRRFGTTVVAEMANISHSLLYAAEKDGRLPPPEYRTDTKKPVRAGYTVNQINRIRDVFGTRPSKPANAKGSVVGFLNLKGGSQKTTTTQLFAQYLATRGYRVLLLDTDPQGSLSFLFGLEAIDLEYHDTMAPYLLEDDKALVESGFKPGSAESLRYAIHETYWDNIDIIPACLQNLSIDISMGSVMQALGRPQSYLIMRLREGLMDVADDYDFILIDGTPSLNFSTLNVLSACDVCFIPTPAAVSDFVSTMQFVGLVGDTIRSYRKEFNVCPNLPDIRFVVTKYNGTSHSEYMSKAIRAACSVERGDVLKHEIYMSDEIGKAGTTSYSIYEQNPSDVDNPKRLKKTIENYDAVFQEMLDAAWDVSFGPDQKQSSMSVLNETETAK